MSSRIVQGFIEETLDSEELGDLERVEDKYRDYIKDEPIPTPRSASLVLAGLILREWREYGFISAITYGRQGTGKSVYNMKVASQVLGVLKYRVSWKGLVDNYVLFSVEDIVRALTGKDRVPVIVWDDAGVHGSSYTWFLDRKQVYLLSALFQTARTKVSGFLMNTPNPSFVLKHFRSVDSYIIPVVKIDNSRSAAIGYKIRFLPTGKSYIRKVFIDEFTRRVDFYPYYFEKRKRYTDLILSRLNEYIRQDKTDIVKKPGRAGDKTVRIMELLKEGYTVREIVSALRVSPKKVIQVRKLMGLSSKD